MEKPVFEHFPYINVSEKLFGISLFEIPPRIPRFYDAEPVSYRMCFLTQIDLLFFL
jgi:hypothetical protein